MRLSLTFQRFFASEQIGGLLLFLATVLALLLANSPANALYQQCLHSTWFGLSVTHWVNDGLMALFFLLIGLELERELYVGELSRFSQALLPVIAALGGMAMPAAIHVALNHGLASQVGIGIPMATDIAFALAVLMLFGARVPAALKVFLVAFAVMDDLGAAIMIALFYSVGLSLPYLWAALVVLLALFLLNRLRVMSLVPYLIGGVCLWWLTLQSGVHATLAGIALAFAIPFRARILTQASPSQRLEHALHAPVAWVILPLFALANTGVSLDAAAFKQLITQPNSLGIMLGLIVGKPLGVWLASRIAIGLGWCHLPPHTHWRHLAGAGMLGGIGFTMSIFMTNLAFSHDLQAVNVAKLAILMASLGAASAGAYFLHQSLPKACLKSSRVVKAG